MLEPRERVGRAGRLARRTVGRQNEEKPLTKRGLRRRRVQEQEETPHEEGFASS